MCSVLTDARRSSGVHIQPPISQQLHHWGTRASAVALGWWACHSLHLKVLLAKDTLSHNHCYELWRMVLLLFSQREAQSHPALPNTFYFPGASGLGWLLQPTQLVRGFPLSEVQKYHLFPSNVKTSFLSLWCRLGRDEIRGLPCRAGR